MLIEDWERESFKDFIYLQEEIELLKKEINEEKERLAAKILVIREEKDNTYDESTLSEVPRDTQEWLYTGPSVSSKPDKSGS